MKPTITKIARPTVAFALLLFVACFPGAQRTFAETWTDSTGSFSIEAKFIGVSGTDIVLQKADGTMIHVPIARLSDASRAQAKRLYEMSKTARPAEPVGAMPAVANTAEYRPKPRQLNFTPPTPPAIPPLQPYPENASLQQAWEHCRDAMLAGRLEVIWQALPDDMQAFVDGQEVRERLRPYAKEQFSVSPEMIDFVNKLTELLVTKKTFVLNSPIVGQVPADFQPLIKAAYDPAVGVIHEYAEMAFNSEAILNHKMSDFLNYHLPRLGGHLHLLIKAIPQEAIDNMIRFDVAQTGQSTGTWTVTSGQGRSEELEMTYYKNRWIPKDMLDTWLEEKDSIIDKMVENAASGLQVGNSPENDAMIKRFLEQANTVMGPLLAANNQQEFDFALGQALFPLMMMMGGAGGAGAAPPGLPAFAQ